MAYLQPALLGQVSLGSFSPPGRYPKLESSTLYYPAFEPLTERHAFQRAASMLPSNTDTLWVRLALPPLVAVGPRFRFLDHSASGFASSA